MADMENNNGFPHSKIDYKCAIHWKKYANGLWLYIYISFSSIADGKQEKTIIIITLDKVIFNFSLFQL